MDPVKRRLVYVADENEALLNELSGTPPTRQSRVTRLLVPPSRSPSPPSQRSSGGPSPAPRPVTTNSAPPNQVDAALLVSYNGFLLTDNSGHFATPRTAAEAALLREALKTCRAYLKQFLLAEQREDLSNSTESMSSPASSSTYVEEDEEAMESDSSSDDSAPAPRHRRGKTAAAAPRLDGEVAQRPSMMTVVQLKEFLRERGVPAAGNKAHLVLRAKSVLENEQEGSVAADIEEAEEAKEESERGNEDAGETFLKEPSEIFHPSPTLSSSVEKSVRRSTTSRSSTLLTPASSALASPTSRTSTDSRGLWGALFTAGSRLFGGTARSSLGFVNRSAAQTDDDSIMPPAKRRRSA